MRFRVRVYRQGKETLVAASDAPLVGRELREEGKKLFVKESFYGGAEHEVEADVLVEQLRFATIANLVGPHTVALAIQEGLVEPENVLEIQGVPHAQIATL
ncbi:MAG: DUF424 domain-containing protein [Thermoplasmatota archaeon]